MPPKLKDRVNSSESSQLNQKYEQLVKLRDESISFYNQGLGKALITVRLSAMENCRKSEKDLRKQDVDHWIKCLNNIQTKITGEISQSEEKINKLIAELRAAHQASLNNRSRTTKDGTQLRIKINKIADSIPEIKAMHYKQLALIYANLLSAYKLIDATQEITAILNLPHYENSFDLLDDEEKMNNYCTIAMALKKNTPDDIKNKLLQRKKFFKNNAKNLAAIEATLNCIEINALTEQSTAKTIFSLIKDFFNLKTYNKLQLLEYTLLAMQYFKANYTNIKSNVHDWVEHLEIIINLSQEYLQNKDNSQLELADSADALMVEHPELDPLIGYNEICYLLGEYYCSIGSYQSGMKFFTRCCETDPKLDYICSNPNSSDLDKCKVLYDLGSIYHYRNSEVELDLHKAKEYYEKGIKLFLDKFGLHPESFHALELGYCIKLSRTWLNLMNGQLNILCATKNSNETINAFIAKGADVAYKFFFTCNQQDMKRRNFYMFALIGFFMFTASKHFIIQEKYELAYQLLSAICSVNLNAKFLLGKLIIEEKITNNHPNSITIQQAKEYIKDSAIGTEQHKYFEAFNIWIDFCDNAEELKKIDSLIIDWNKQRKTIKDIETGLEISKLELFGMQAKVRNKISSLLKLTNSKPIDRPEQPEPEAANHTVLTAAPTAPVLPKPTSVPPKKTQPNCVILSIADIMLLYSPQLTIKINILGLLTVLDNINKISFNASTLSYFCQILGKLFHSAGPERVTLFIPEITTRLQKFLKLFHNIQNKLNFNPLQITTLISGLNNLYLATDEPIISSIMVYLYDKVADSSINFTDWQLLEILRSASTIGIHTNAITYINAIIAKLDDLTLEPKEQTIFLYYLSVLSAQYEAIKNANCRLSEKLIANIEQIQASFVCSDNESIASLRRYNMSVIFWQPQLLNKNQAFWHKATMLLNSLPKGVEISKLQKKIYDMANISLSKRHSDIHAQEEQLIGYLLKPVDICFKKIDVQEEVIAALEIDGPQHFVYNLKENSQCPVDRILRDKFIELLYSKYFTTVPVERIPFHDFNSAHDKMRYIDEKIQMIMKKCINSRLGAIDTPSSPVVQFLPSQLKGASDQTVNPEVPKGSGQAKRMSFS